MVNTLRSDPDTSEEEHFKLMLVMTEMERVKFLIRSYVRTRLHKVRHTLTGPWCTICGADRQIEKYSLHIVNTPELHSLLSGAELQHAKRYVSRQ
jgi:GINS complex subunit 4